MYNQPQINTTHISIRISIFFKQQQHTHRLTPPLLNHPHYEDNNKEKNYIYSYIHDIM
ncbi:hypothetical protein DOY81_012254 [Sarcophaga bullata]|nr:hypothetical protein DOY81_012254 [Sarcophaga bullata]